MFRAIQPYVDIARPSHWLKNVFVAPGVLLAITFSGLPITDAASGPVFIAFAAACLVASSNYVLNEILDAPSDRFHPDKQSRPIPSGLVSIPVAYAEFAVLALAGVGLALTVNVHLASAAALLWVMGLFYNVPPLRMKDRPYLDVVCESINNPIRLAIGWYATGLTQPITLSAIVAYWMFGAFLMAVKRLAEYRHIGDEARAGHYRRSFRHYNEEYLQLSILFYTAFFGMSAGVFIARYRVELVMAIPFVALAMAQYLHVGYKPDSPVQHPEKLYRDRKLFAVVVLAFCVSTALLLWDIPQLHGLFAPRFEPVGGP